MNLAKKLWWIPLVALYIGLSYHSQKAENPAPVYTPRITQTLTYQQDPALLADAQRLGIDVSKLNLAYATNLHASDIPDDSNTIAIYQWPGTITIKSGMGQSQTTQSLAYEYMHYVWANLDASERTTRGQSYQTYMLDNPVVKSNLQYLSGSTDTINNEINSIACTEISPSQLIADLNNYCNHWIPNRAILFL